MKHLLVFILEINKNQIFKKNNLKLNNLELIQFLWVLKFCFFIKWWTQIEREEKKELLRMQKKVWLKQVYLKEWRHINKLKNRLYKSRKKLAEKLNKIDLKQKKLKKFQILKIYRVSLHRNSEKRNNLSFQQNQKVLNSHNQKEKLKTKTIWILIIIHHFNILRERKSGI